MELRKSTSQQPPTIPPSSEMPHHERSAPGSAEQVRHLSSRQPRRISPPLQLPAVFQHERSRAPPGTELGNRRSDDEFIGSSLPIKAVELSGTQQPRMMPLTSPRERTQHEHSRACPRPEMGTLTPPPFRWESQSAVFNIVLPRKDELEDEEPQPLPVRGASCHWEHTESATEQRRNLYLTWKQR